VAVRPRARNPRLLMVLLVVASLVTITVDYRQGERGPLEGIGRASLAVITPLQKAVSKVTRPIGDFFSALGKLPELQEENERLRAELDQAQAQLAKQASDAALIDEYEALLELQERKIDRASTGALVIANGVSNFEWTITIDKGIDDGVRVGDAVVASRGLVGQVVRATGSAADVRLIIDPDAGVFGQIAATKDRGVVLGQGDSDMRMRLVSPSTPPNELNNRVVETVGYAEGPFTNVYPKGLAIGTISAVKESAGALDTYVTVAPAVDFASLDAVLVVHQEEA
jgi:rod shape-determining protein MreC